jgi:hypothetical protein
MQLHHELKQLLCLYIRCAMHGFQMNCCMFNLEVQAKYVGSGTLCSNILQEQEPGWLYRVVIPIKRHLTCNTYRIDTPPRVKLRAIEQFEQDVSV